jgi:iron(III) transport system ATP-binding protein
MSPSEVFLKLNALSKSFNGRKIIDCLDLEVYAGEVFCILGPSGCGKTTLLRMIAGLELPDQGSIEIGGKIVVENSRTRMAPQNRRIGYVFQDLALWPHLTVAENLEFVLKAHGISKKSIASSVGNMLNLVHLSGFDDQRPETLSGGEQQRLAIARALMGNPLLVLMDEPLSSMDSQLRGQLRQEVLQWIKELGVTAVWITHDQNEAVTVADRMAIVSKGCLIQVGSPDEFRKRLSDDSVRQILMDVSSNRDVDTNWRG